MKLRLKLLLLLVPLVVAPLLALGWIAYVELAKVSEDKLFDAMRASVEHIEAHTSTTLDTALANIELFARHTLVRQYILTEDETERYNLLHGPLLRVFSGFQEAFPEYYEIRTLLADGYEDLRLASPGIDNVNKDEAQSPLFRAMAAAGESVTSMILRNPDNGRISLYVGKPLILRDPPVDAIGVPASLRGYLVVTVALNELEAHARNDVIGQRGRLLALDRDGRPLFPSSAERSARPLAAALVDRVLHATRGGGRPLLLEIDGQRAFVSATEVLPDLSLLALLPETELLQASSRVAALVAAITLIAIALTAAGLFLALHFLVIRPVQRLEMLSREIGRGRLDIPNTLDSSDEIGRLAAAFQEMAFNLRSSNERIRYIAYHDSLTGLPNRAMFQEYLGRVIADARRADKQFALLFLDIDDFKRVNDTLGHQAGDRLLQQITDRLSHCLRQSDFVARVDGATEPDELVARLGGDEFVILLPDLKTPHTASSLAGRLLEALAAPLAMADHEFYISASIGITLYPSDGTDAETLIKNADIAMYHAKERGKNDYQYYLESMNVLAHERLAVENKLRKALENNELCLHYQPQIDAASGAIVGLEALLRWHHPGEGMIPPAVFIPVAEESGLMLAIGEWIINEACRQSSAWTTDGLTTPPISVNVSGIQFGKQDVPRLIRTALARHHLQADRLEIEITESVIASQPDKAVKELAAIRDLGVGIALDDFGTGYSPFSYLYRFPIDTLKIDRGFVSEIGVRAEQADIVSAIIAMAHLLKLRVVAEGIEDAGQYAVLSERGCDVVQGYLFSPPLPADQVARMLKKPFLNIRGAKAGASSPLVGLH